MSGPSVGLVGAGAIGGFLAAKLGAAGMDLRVLARGATLAALRGEGLCVASATGDVRWRPAVATDDAARIGPVDLVLFCVKAYDTGSALAAMAPMVGPRTTVLSLQNGMTGAEALAAALGPDRLALGVTWVPATVEAPGRIRHTGTVRRFVFGPATPRDDPALAALAAHGRAAGLDMAPVADPRPAIWEKLVVLAPFHGIGALTRLPLGGWIGRTETRELYATAMAEVAAVGRALGVALADDIVARNLAFSQNVAAPGTRASMLDDIEAGRRLELDASLGWLVRAGARTGTPVPVLAALHALLAPRAGGDPQRA